MKLRKFLISVFVVLFSVNAFALKVPELNGAVNDNAHIIDSSDRWELEGFLEALSAETGTQIAVLTVNSLEGESIEGFAIEVAEKWKLGQKNVDNGVLLLISMAEKKIRIETGYGLEGDLTDEKCGLIIRNVIAPQFQQGNYSGGITSGVKAIAAIAVPEFTGNDARFAQNIERDERGTLTQRLVVFMFFMIYLFLFTGAASQRHSALSWLPWAVLFRSRGTSGHYYSGGSSWSSGGSGFDGTGGFGGGGGFSGGGGGFGGGGASGGW